MYVCVALSYDKILQSVRYDFEVRRQKQPVVESGHQLISGDFFFEKHFFPDFWQMFRRF